MRVTCYRKKTTEVFAADVPKGSTCICTDPDAGEGFKGVVLLRTDDGLLPIGHVNNIPYSSIPWNVVSRYLVRLVEVELTVKEV